MTTTGNNYEQKQKMIRDMLRGIGFRPQNEERFIERSLAHLVDETTEYTTRLLSALFSGCETQDERTALSFAMYAPAEVGQA